MSTLYRTSRKLTALALPAFAIISFAGCSSEEAAPGTGGASGATVVSGGSTALGGPNTMNLGATTGGASGTGGAANTGGGTPTSGGTGAGTGSTGGMLTGGTGGTGTGATSGTGAASGTGGVSGDGGAGSGGSGPIRTGDCVLPELPAVDTLPRNEKLPDPFTFFNGDKVTTKEQWECRRREIQHMAATYIYGPYPFEPETTTGTVSGGDVSITCTEGGNTETFSASISGSGDVITLNMGSGILPSGKSLSFGGGFEGKIKSLFGFSDNMNTNVATGWMVDRVIEVLEQNTDSGHDPTKMAVSGCSGCGKGAFLVGVFSRIPMTIIVESGGGGAANLRQAEWFRHGDGQAGYQCSGTPPQSIDNLEDDGICGPWVGSVAAPLRSQPDLVNHLPFDQHLLLATMAPRYLVHFSNDHGVDSWCHLGGTCEALSAWAAAPVWNALGVKDNMAFELYSGGHCGVGDTGIAAAMFDRAFNGNTSGSTGSVTIQDSRLQQPQGEWEAMWIDWDMNTVLQ